MFNPERLILARQARGMVQDDLAELIGRSKSTISRWENGENCPKYEALSKLSSILSLPERWFSLASLEDNSIYQFRSLQRTEVSLRDKARAKLLMFHEITGIFEEWVDYPKLNIVKPLCRNDSLKLSDAQIESIAESQREMWGLGNSPLPNLIRLIENSGVMVTSDYIGSKDMDGVSTWIGNKPYILFAKDKGNYFRNRFDVAHEFAHIILHKNLTQNDCKKIGRHEIERQANYFAGCLLMPNNALSVGYKKITLDTLLVDKRHWGVSVSALIMRHHQIGTIDDDHKVRLFRNYSYREWRHAEPFDDKYEPEKPELMKNTIDLLLSDGGFKPSDIMNVTYYHVNDIESLCSVPEGILSKPSYSKPKLRLLA